MNTMSVRGWSEPYAYWLGVVAIVASALGGMQPAKAILMTTPLTGTAQEWEVSYDTDFVDLFSWTDTNLIADELQLNMSWNGTSESTVITFSQVGSAVDYQGVAGSNFGFRVNISMQMTNDSGDSWTGFEMLLDDPSTPSPQGNAVHAGFAHFHGQKITGVPFNHPLFSNPDPSTLVDFENSDFLELSGGVMATGATDNWSVLAMHQYEDAGAVRSFSWIFTPVAVPEPASLLMLSMGLAGLAFARQRKSHRK